VRAIILLMKGKVTESQANCQRALAIKPDYAKAFSQLGHCHLQQSNAEAAVSCFDRSLAINPDDEITLSARIFALDFIGDCDFAGQQAARSEWWHRIGSRISAEHPAQYDNDRDPTRRIVLGYVSADFREHSAAFAFRPVLERHDKTRFEVICYSGSPADDTVTDSFRQVAGRWRNALHWSDDQLMDCILADKVDILIDLSGHTDGNRLRTFARKPAPIQITAWGHATGTGLPTIDYLFSDPALVPSEVRHLFAEQIFDLPCAMIIEPPPTASRSAEPPVTSNGYVTYGVFNRVSKLSDAAIGVWTQILRSDVTSRLIIKDRLIDDASTRNMLLEKFARHAITPDRMLLLGSTSREEHLATYRRVDICLDPFPQAGGVSTWESLYMGVPVVAKLGSGVSSRMGGAILSTIGMADWVAADNDQYVEIALRSTPERLRAIRHELPDLIDRRCSPAAYTRAVDAAYRTMWQKYCSGLPGQPG
jgi:predicted O-linked N-acetylglucosamine transferase (SPINDLY family)